jgi:hypothetical protein
MREMSVCLHLACGEKLEFETGMLLDDWLRTVGHRLDRLQNHYIIECALCQQCPVGRALANVGGTMPAPEVGIRRRDGSVFIPDGRPIPTRPPES